MGTITLDHLRTLDPKFDFTRAYKQNYCTLLMVKVRPARPSLKYTLNGVEKELTDTDARFTITYRIFGTDSEWQIDHSKLQFWKSQSEAVNALSRITKDMGMEKLDEAGILDTYMKAEEAHTKMRETLDEIKNKA